MPVTDYNKKKELEVTSQNDSGSTIDKAQPILLTDGDDSTTGTGDIIIDFTNVSSDSDIAVYDESGNLLNYEIENRTSTGAVLWVYGSWVRDDTVQAQVVYGDGPSSSEEDVTGTWNNTGQNAERVYHMNSKTDSTGNADLSFTGTTDVSGDLDGAKSFDGTDDVGETANNSGVTGSGTVVLDFKPADITGDEIAAAGGFGGTNTAWEVRTFFNDKVGDSSDDYQFGSFDGNQHKADVDGDKFSTAEYNYTVNTYTGSTYKVFLDGNDETDQVRSGGTGFVSSNARFTVGALDENGSIVDNADTDVDEIRIYSDSKNSTWAQAEYDASPKAGQVFFSQQAAESTVPDKTASIPVTQNTQTTPDPQVQAGTVTVTTPETVLTQTTENPQVQAGTASLTIQETQLTATNPDITLEPGFSRIQVTPTALTQTTENPEINATFDVSIPETQLTASNPDPSITVGDTLIVPETQLTVTNPSIQVTPGDSAVTVPETQLTASNPDIALNRSIVFGVVTQLNATNPEPNLEPGIVQTNIPETQLTQTTVNPQVEPGETQVQVTSPTELTVFTPDIKVTPGNTDLGIDETVLLQTTPEPNLGLDLQFVSPTNALITNKNRYFDMPDHTFKQNDFGDTLTATLKDGDNPNGVSIQGNTGVNLVVETFDGKKVLDKEMTVTDAQNGKVEYEWETGDFIEDTGVYKAEIKVFDATDEPETFPNNGYRSITVEDELE